MKDERWKIREISNNKTGVTPASCHSRVKRELINPTQGRLFLLAARQKPSLAWLLLSLRSVGCHPYPQNLPLEIPFLALSGSVEWRVSSFIFPLSSFILNFPFSAESLAGRELRRKFLLKNGDFLIVSKMRSIRFRKFTAQIPTMIHRAVLAPPFWRQKVAETNV